MTVRVKSLMYEVTGVRKVLNKYLFLLFILSGHIQAAEPEVPLVNCQKVMVLDGSPTGHMKMPTDVAVDDEGKIYVVDSANHQILVFAADGKYLMAFGSQGKPGEVLSYPVGITTTSDGLVLVADRGNQKIRIFNSDGSLQKTFDTKIEEGRYTPVDVAVDSEGKRIFVTASKPFHQIMVLDANGNLISRWGQAGSNKGEFRFPATIAVSPEDDEIYLVDVLNTRVQAFDMNGSFLVTVGSWGVTPGKLFRPKGVAVMKDNSILVSDSYLGVVQLYDSDTRFRAVLGVDGKIARFNTPTGLQVDDRNRVYIVETMADRVTVCQLSPL